MNRTPAQVYAAIFTLALLTSQIWSWFAAPHMDEASNQDTHVEAEQSREAALLFKLLTPAPSDDRPMWTQQLPEASKDHPKPLLSGGLAVTDFYRDAWGIVEVPSIFALSEQAPRLRSLATLDHDPTRAPPILGA